MTSGNFTLVNIGDIEVKRETRQRRKLEKVDELAESIRQNGLMHPIIITRDYVLVAGERRLAAHQLLQFDQIYVQFTDEVDEERLHLLELEENTKRLDLQWQEQIKAVADYHNLRTSMDKNWSQEQTGHALNMSQTSVARYLITQQMMDDGVEAVVAAPKLSTALNAADRKRQRQKDSILADLTSDVKTAEEPLSLAEVDREVKAPAPTQPKLLVASPPKPEEETKRRASLLNANFLEWCKEPQKTPFNFIHCDFPYGVNAGDKTGYSAADVMGKYDDGEEVYLELLETFLKNQDNFIAESAHVMFWFAMDYYHLTKMAFERHGWSVNPYPLIWYKTNNAGIMPDAKRGPRRVYETALMITRGDRRVVRPISNAFGTPTTREYHTSEKPHAMLSNFFRMFVDEYSRVLDPTCGSGMAVRVAEEAGAEICLGLEKDEEFYGEACRNLQLS